ncbi:MAG: 50S ribosomal protein L3 [Chloroflexota bacterium]|nr:50S ribosomal protein L3 [Chloroflexota bacterium]
MNRKGLLGRKVGMTQLFDDEGRAVPVTVIEAGPCYVTQVKTVNTDGYNAIQVGFGHAKSLVKPALGHLGDLPPLRHLREIKTDDVDQYEVGQMLDVTTFEPGEAVDVTGVSKGRGFAGGMKRYGFSGGPKTHGQSDRHRAVGSIGSTTTPGRVKKGKRMPGHMGDERVTMLNLEVVRVYPERNLIAVHGSVPGPKQGLLLIRDSVKARAAQG